MRSHIRILAAAAIMAAAALHAKAICIGYCTDDIGRDNIFRIGSTERQGIAIRLSHDKLQLLKGQQITGMSAAFGSKRTTDGTVDLFVATAPDAQPLASAKASISSVTKWLDFTFGQPYTITGDEPELYIGYSAEISTKSSMLICDFTTDAPGQTYLYSDGAWIDACGLGYGAAALRVNVSGDLSFSDLMLKPVATTGYFKAGEQYTLSAQVFNFGTTAINAFDVNVTVGNNEPQTLTYNGQNIGQNAVFDITLPPITADADGRMPVCIDVTNINSAADATPADNMAATDIFFYPAAMERNILIEGFTGQACSNCPAGHATVEEFIESATTTPIIEVMHHSGYMPDFMTTNADVDYTLLYGSGSTYAPAVMVNRAHYPQIGQVPVMNTSASNLKTAYAIAESTQPYVSLALETSYDAATRQVTATLSTQAHVDLPADINVLNIMLVQDGIVSMQVPYGSNYTHNAVMRGVITGNAWGIMLDKSQAQAGGRASWSTTFTLPETIIADYYTSLSDAERPYYEFPAVAENMYLVAYVASFRSNDPNGHSVYNSLSVPLGSSYSQGGMSGINVVTPDATTAPVVRVANRQIVVDAQYDSLQVFTADGRSMPATAQLAPGIYVVRIVTGTNITTQKVMVR